MSKVYIDFNQKMGAVKNMNCVNNGPSGSLKEIIGNFEYYKALEIPYARTHDSSFETRFYEGEYVVDVHRIFPDFNADENDEASYLFVPTDFYLENMVEAGTQPFYRLGASIEHGHKKGTIPPKDFVKWARICEHIVRHYTEGWANGFKMNIEYWEIWNEYECRDGNGTTPCWQGTEEQFYDFYETVAKHLKSTFPHLKIGGPALTSSWTGDNFLAEMKRREVPIDFYSFHWYSASIDEFEKMIENAANQLVKYGYENAELHLNEWNYTRGWTRDDLVHAFRVIKGMKGAAFSSSVMSALQKTKLDLLMYYEGRLCCWCGLFDSDWQTPLKTYYSFLAFKEIKKLGESVLSKSEDDIYTIASFDGKKGAAIISRFNDGEVEDSEVTVELNNAPTDTSVEIYLLDESHDLELIEKVSLENKPLHLKMPNNTVYLIKAV